MCQAAPMASPNPSAAGAPLAVSVLAGATIGAIAHQSVLGAAIGLGVGIVIAVALWLRDRARIGR